MTPRKAELQDESWGLEGRNLSSGPDFSTDSEPPCLSALIPRLCPGQRSRMLAQRCGHMGRV